MSGAEYSFHLPEGLIAQEPAPRRGDARLLLVDPGRGVTGEIPFRGLEDQLADGDLLVMNESRVLPARLHTRRADTGGRVEVLLVRPEAEPGTWLAMARPARRLREGVVLALAPPGASLEVVGRRADGMVLVRGSSDPALLAEEHGVMPLPRYIARTEDDERAERDRRRYQTVFAAGRAGSVAAPTAGLHFSQEHLDRLRTSGVRTATVSLHVGPGTFQPPNPEQIADRRLHRESFRLPAETARAVAETRERGGRVIAVGTTSLRVLETAARLDLPVSGGRDRLEYSEGGAHFTGSARRTGGHWEVTGVTRLFIAPPDRVACVDGLLTNFHLPGSSLLMLVASMIGNSGWRRVYEHAVTERMRFYSYGDCMLILAALGGV